MQHQLHRKCFGELLPALEIKPDNANQIETKQEVVVPEVRGLTIEEATKKIKEVQLDINVNTQTDNKETKIKDQLPKPGVKIYEGTKVEIYV